MSGAGLSERACVCVHTEAEKRKTTVESVAVRAVDIYILVEMMPFWGGRKPCPWKRWLCPPTPDPCHQVMHPANPFWCEMVYDLAIKSNVVRM